MAIKVEELELIEELSEEEVMMVVGGISLQANAEISGAEAMQLVENIVQFDWPGSPI